MSTAEELILAGFDSLEVNERGDVVLKVPKSLLNKNYLAKLEKERKFNIESGIKIPENAIKRLVNHSEIEGIEGIENIDEITSAFVNDGVYDVNLKEGIIVIVIRIMIITEKAIIEITAVIVLCC